MPRRQVLVGGVSSMRNFLHFGESAARLRAADISSDEARRTLRVGPRLDLKSLHVAAKVARDRELERLSAKVTAIFVIRCRGVRVENLDFSGTRVRDGNGAGIRLEGGGSLTVQRCRFEDNENGILTSNARE